MQACLSPQLALLDREDELAQALAQLKHHEVSYVAVIIRREVFLLSYIDRVAIWSLVWNISVAFACLQVL
jgi:hypothetical protein